MISKIIEATMFKFGPRRKCGPIGLDITDDSIKMLQLGYKQGQLAVTMAKRVSLSTEEDEPQRKQSVVAAIHGMLEEGGFRGKQVVTCLPNDAWKVTSVRLDPADSVRTGAELNKEAAYRFGLDPEVDAIRYLPAGEIRHGDQVKQEMILFGAEDGRIRSHISFLEESRLVPVGIDPLPCALFRGHIRQMRRQRDKEQAVMYVHVGSRDSTVVFGIQGEICFIKQIPIGVVHVDREIADKLDVSMEEAQRMRLSLRHSARDGHTLAGPDVSSRGKPQARPAQEPDSGKTAAASLDQATRQALLDPMNSIAEQLINEISLCLRYYTVTFRGQRVGSALVSGVGADTPLLIDTFRRHLPFGVGVVESFRGLKSLGRLSQDPPTEWAIAIGLALKGIEAARSQREEKPKTNQLISVG